MVQEAIASPEAFGPTPIIAIFDNKVEEKLGVLPYFNLKDVDGMTEIKQTLADYRGTRPDSSAPKYQQEAWKDTRGRSIQATYVTSTETMVTLRLSTGKLSTFPIEKLSEAGRSRVSELAKDSAS